MAQPTTYQRVTSASDYDGSAGPIAQKYDGVDDSMATAAFSAGTLTSSMDCLIAVRRDSGAKVTLGGYQAGHAKFFGIAESADANPASTGVGTPTTWVDGIQLAGGTAVTRATLHTALTLGAWHILELRGMDLSLWTSFLCGGYFAGYRLNGARGDIMLYPSTTPTEDKDAARQWLADYYGVTLP